MKTMASPSNTARRVRAGVFYDFFIKGFGFTALFIGIGLLLLMVYAYLAGGHHF